MKLYKLTDEHGQTRGGTQWGEGVTHTATGTGTELCSDGWIDSGGNMQEITLSELENALKEGAVSLKERKRMELFMLALEHDSMPFTVLEIDCPCTYCQARLCTTCSVQKKER
jgi:hypothetical protein